MNSLTFDPAVEKKKRLRAALDAVYALAGKPDPNRPDQVLWKGSLAEVRQTMRHVAEDADAVPETDADTTDLLNYARPTLRQRGFIYSVRKGVVSIKTKPDGYLPELGPNSIGDVVQTWRKWR